MTPGSPPAFPSDHRAQTPIDFGVGAGVFLITLAFVIAFVPTLFDPFAAAESTSPIVSDRVAAGFAGDLLAASTSEPGVLSPACTVAYFTADGSLTEQADCGFDASEDPDELFGVDREVQVVIHELDERSPRNSPLDLETVETRHGTFEDVVFSRSSEDPDAPDPDDVTVSGRVVSLDGDQYRLTVRVW